MNVRHFIIATAGHVDHGKSALVQALTGTHPDRLPEEKARGITIDLGFGHLRLTTGEREPVTLEIGIIDVPGHEDFVKNMVAGAGAVDLALLVVAADDGWMPQTEEHLQVLTYLGVPQLVVALTKSELEAERGSVERGSVERGAWERGPSPRPSPHPMGRGITSDGREGGAGEAEESGRIAAVRKRLLGSPYAEAPIIPTSTITGRGLAELRSELARRLAAAVSPRDIGKPRLPIDRAFTLPGIGTVVTGTLTGGCLQQGQEVVIQPTGKVTRIRALQSYNQELACAGPGARTALNLAEVAVAAKGREPAEELAVRRGQVVTLPGLGTAHDCCEVLLERSPRLLGLSGGAGRPLKHGTRIRCHLGSGNTAGCIFLADRSELKPGEQCLAQIRFEAPVFAFLGDRFVIRDWAEQLTLAGGVVLEPVAPPGKFRCGGGAPLDLGALAQIPGNALAAVERQLQRHRVLRRGSLLTQSRFSAAEIADALARLSGEGKLVLPGDFVVASSEWKALQERARASIAAWHQAHPEQMGLPLTQLRASLGAQLPSPELFEAVVADLSGFVQAGPIIKRATHRPSLPAHLQAAGARIRAALAAKQLDPPARKELAADRAGQEALRFLVQAGEAVELGPEVVLAAASFMRATEAVRQYLRQHGWGTVSELRQALGASRRIVVPLLEVLDRQGVTRREGDRRCLKASAITSPL